MCTTCPSPPPPPRFATSLELIAVATHREGLAAARPRCQFLSAVACGCQLVSLFGISSGNETCSVSVCRLQNEKVIITETHLKEPWKENSFEICMGEGRHQSVFDPGLIQTGSTMVAAGSRRGSSNSTAGRGVPASGLSLRSLLGWNCSSVGLAWVHRDGFGPDTALRKWGEPQPPYTRHSPRCSTGRSLGQRC